ncbi:ABC transporter ATP-binding protein, partial [Streptococcus suis]
SKGECVAVVGPSGSGKTTLLNSIAGYLDYQGHITLAQQPIDNLAPWQRHCRYLTQRLYLFPHKTVSGNLRLAQPNADCEAQHRLLAKLKIAHLRDRYPHQLSGGEQQRVSIARALAKNPKLLLFDEPTGALDYQTGKQILTLLQDMARTKGATVVIVTHNAAIAPIADRVIFMHVAQVTKTVINKE